MDIKSVHYSDLVNLYLTNEFLVQREDSIVNLFNSCKNPEEKRLVIELLERFRFLNDANHNMLLNNMIQYIADLNLDYKKTQFVSTTMDSDPDSGQAVIYSIRNKIYEKLTKNFKISNTFNKAVENYHKGYTNIIVIDELIGSGKTVRSRYRTFLDRKTKDEPFNIYFVYMLGVEYFVNILKNEGYNIFCSSLLKRGITDNYEETERTIKIKLMEDLERRLCPKINEKELVEYSFGYGKAEVLYTGESHNYNTPNSVFPIFWWTKDYNEQDRNTILNRYEAGF